MDTIGERIKSVLVRHSVTQKKFAEDLGITEVAVSNYMNKDRVPNTEVLIKIKQLFNDVDLNWLLIGVETLKESQILNNIFREPDLIYNNGLPKVISTDHQGEENILLVPHYAQAGYLDGYGDPEFLESLPSYRLPKIDNGTFRIFEVKGHSMIPTLHDGSLAVGEWCENLEDIKDDQIYIIVTKVDGIVIKRVLNRVNKYNNLYLKSDNRSEYPAYTITPDQVLEIWKLKTAFIYNFTNPADMYDRLTDLEAEMMQIKQSLNK
jgi:phage repressor protein C with HTH and peptisase S24 domain